MPTTRESPDGTILPAYDFITDHTGAFWGLAPSGNDGMIAMRNAAAAGFTAQVNALVYAHGLVYQTNGQGWWYWRNGSQWVSSRNPAEGPPTDGESGGPIPPQPPDGGDYVATLAAPSGRDDTTMINQTLASAGSGIVHAPGGNEWLHAGVITIPANTTLQGDGDSSVFRATDTGTDPDMAIELAGDGAGLANVLLVTDYPTGQGMAPGDSNGSGNRSSQPYSHLVYIPGNVSGFVISAVHGIGGASGGIYSGGARGGMIVNCMIEYALADGIGLYQGTSDTVVRGCAVTGCGDDGIAIVPYDNTQQGSGIVIEDNTVTGGYWGRGITDVGSSGAIIRNNVISDYYASGMEADHDTGAGTQAPTGGTWDGNTVSNCPNLASGYSSSFLVLRDVTNYTLTNNRAINMPPGTEALVVDPSSQVTQQGNSWN